MPETIEKGMMIPPRRQLVTESWKSLAPNGALVGAIIVMVHEPASELKSSARSSGNQ